MLRTESGGDIDVAASGQRIERVRQVLRDRGRVREQCDAPAAKRRAQSRFGDESIDAKFHWCAVTYTSVVIPGPERSEGARNPPSAGGYGFRARRFAAPRND